MMLKRIAVFPNRPYFISYCKRCGIPIDTSHKDETNPLCRFCTDKAAYTEVAEDDDFWDKAVNEADMNRKMDTQMWTTIEKLRHSYRMRVRVKPDREYPDDRTSDWEIYIGIHFDTDSNKLYFTLVEEFPSTWDGFPVYSGGQISFEKFKQCMTKKGIHLFDGLTQSNWTKYFNLL